MKNIETILYTDMKRYALRMCNGNVHDAEDLVQDLAEAVYRDIDVYLNKTYLHLKNLLYQALEWIRCHKYQYLTAKKRIPGDNYDHTTVENDAWGLLEKWQLQTALLKLTKTQSVYFRLRLDGYNLYEIGGMFSRTSATIHMTIQTAKKNIIKQLN